MRSGSAGIGSDKNARLEAFDRQFAGLDQAMLDLDARFAERGDGGLDRHFVAEAVGHAEDGAGFHDRMADEFEGLEVIEFAHPDRGFHHFGGGRVEHREIARVKHDAGGVAVAPFDAEMPGVAEHSK